MAIFKLSPGYRDYIWGGRRLITDFKKDFSGDKLAETWELSCYPDCPSTIINGTFAGLSLQEYIDREGWEVLGKNCGSFERFPVLIKFLDAGDRLSVQVHPDDEYAHKNEGQNGKTEMWYILDAAPGAFIYYGFERELTEEEFVSRIEDETLMEVLHKVPVKRGDVFFLPPGTLHAVGKGILLAEIQQNSDITYRIYDYGRLGKDGKPRELHVEKAKSVLDLSPVKGMPDFSPHLGSCKYFTVDRLILSKENGDFYEGSVDGNSFLSILCTCGEGVIEDADGELPIKKGDSFFLPANSGGFSLKGELEALLTTV